MTEFKSQVRDSVFTKLAEKVRERDYGQYLSKVTIEKLRAFGNQTITFDFPVTALIGPNGGGKTTILGAAGLAYKSVKPGRFFAKNWDFDTNMENWQINYELINKTESIETLARTANFAKFKWRRENLIERNVLIFGIARTVPPTEKTEFRRFTVGKQSVDQEHIRGLEREIASSITKVLGIDVANYKYMSIEKEKISLLCGTPTIGQVQYSEFHFGAGQSSIIRMIIEIESNPKNTLILIEEIENGLHPTATVRMVEYLVELADRKSCQILFTTHSDYALKPLPPQAIWIALNGKVFQGKPTIEALRTLTGEVSLKLVVFTEDNFSKEWIESMLRDSFADKSQQIVVYEAKGDGTAVNLNAFHNSDPSNVTPSFCFIDGDSKQNESSENRIIRLPGGIPEIYLYEEVISIIEGNDTAFKIFQNVLGSGIRSKPEILQKIKSTKSLNRDPHTLYEQIGNDLSGTPVNNVKNAFFNIWNYKKRNATKGLLRPLEAFLELR